MVARNTGRLSRMLVICNGEVEESFRYLGSRAHYKENKENLGAYAGALVTGLLVQTPMVVRILIHAGPTRAT